MRTEKKPHRPFLISFFMTVFLFIPAAAILPGCLSTQPTRYYSLAPVETKALASVSGTIPRDITVPLVGIGPLQLAKYLDRTQIVIRPAPHRVEISEFDQWISNPTDQIYLTIQENLSALLATNSIVRYPWKRSREPDFQVIIEVMRMDGISGKEVQLIARWQLYQKNGARLIASEKAKITEAMSREGFDSLAMAHSKALGELCRTIATKIAMARQKTDSY